VLTDAAGVPLAVTVTAANTHDIHGALPTIIDVPPVKGRRGRPRTRPNMLVADKAYDSHALRDILKWLGIHPDIPQRGERCRGLGRKRWPVERTLAWLHQFRRLRIRWERKLDNHLAFLQLAAAVVCYRTLKSPFCQ
jgi:transposase